MATQSIVCILGLSAAAAPIYKAVCLKNKIKKCWPSIKCTPIGQILHPIFGPSSISSSENSQTCNSGMFSSMFSSSISGTNSNVSLLTEITSSISSDVNSIRTKIQSMEQSAFNDLMDIATKIFQAYGRIAQLLVTIYGIISKVAAVFKDLMQLILLAYYSLGSMWNGPIGGTARYFGSL